MKRTLGLPGVGRSHGRAAVVVMLLVALLLQLLAVAAPASTAQRAPSITPVRDRWYLQVEEDPGLEVVVAAYNVLQDRFFRPLDSRQLLGAAWEGARRGLTQQRRLPSGIAAPELSGDREGDLAQFANQYRALLAQAGPDADRQRVGFVAAEAMAASVGEQHTGFLTPEQFTQFTSSLTSERATVGLGIVLDGQRGPFTIETVIPGAPAAGAGIQEGDQIERVDGRDVSRADLRELTGLLRGEAGQPVTLGLRRAGQPIEVTVVRDRYALPPFQTRVLPEGVCHLRLSTFPLFFVVGPSGRTAAGDLDAALEQCEQAGAQGWIMDLRANGGGSTLTLSQLLGRFMDPGPISVERDKIGGRFESATDGHLFRVQRPLVVLIDGGSASASEAFAAAVQEYGRGVVVGQRSAGVLNTAQVVPLPHQTGLSVATQEFFTGRREVSVDGVGVTPDVVLGRGADPAAVPREAIDLALQPPAGIGPLPPPATDPPGAVLSEAELRRLIEPVQLRPEDAERPEDAVIQGDLAIDHLNFYAGGTPSLVAGRERGLRLGWRGGLVRFLGGGFPPPYALDVELYRDADGAHRDFREVYEPGEPRNPPQVRDVTPPVTLGDDTRALVGTGQNEGRISLSWRRGGTIYTVSRNVPIGEAASFDGLARLAQIVDARAAAQ